MSLVDDLIENLVERNAIDLNGTFTVSLVDGGEPLPTVNDGFAGAAPDLGALESGQPEPHYGPRWLKAQPFYR